MDKLTVDERALDLAYTSFCGFSFLRSDKERLRKAINRYIHAVQKEKSNG